MMIGYLDLINYKIYNLEALRAVVDELLTDDVQSSLRDLDLVALYQGAGPALVIGTECDSCGAPIGLFDPDYCAYVRLATCSDCRD